ncbi:MAG: TlyA family RNA methyltransferase [Firmicutes bacterium]|nr:TlyA family RNA methyltransferase [Bacillota bacterium]
MQKHKERLDVRMVTEGLAESREKAKALIMSGNVFVDEQREDKAGTMIPDTAKITVKGHVMPYVSRGGLKLEKAMEAFGLRLDNCICMDAGASTGGFTDCMLQKGATKVYAVDVGYGQLAWKLRTDERVVVLEKTNVRYLNEEIVPDLCDFASADLSFISLTKVLESIASCIRPEGQLVCLVKPQFEAGREKVGKKGVVRDPAVHEEVLEMITNWVQNNGFHILGLTFSPVRGPEGNIEYLLYMEKKTAEAQDWTQEIKKVVKESHDTL